MANSSPGTHRTSRARWPKSRSKAILGTGASRRLGRRAIVVVVTTSLTISGLAAGTSPAVATEDSVAVPQSQPNSDTDETAAKIALVTTRDREITEACSNPKVVSLEVHDLESGLSELAVTNETDCTAGVTRVRTSPDRSMVTYEQPGPSTSILELASGGIMRSIHDCGKAEWNPDGSLLACREQNGSLKIIVVETGSNVNSFALPDGVPVDGFDWVGPTELLATSTGAGAPCVLPSRLGPKRSAMWRIEIAEPTFSRLTDSPCDSPYGEIQVSADFDAISFVSGGELYIAAIDGSSPAKVAPNNADTVSGRIRAARWSTSGSQLLVLTEPDGPTSDPNPGTQIETVDATTGSRAVVVTLDRNIVDMGDTTAVVPIGQGSVDGEQTVVSPSDQDQETVGPDVGILASIDDEPGPVSNVTPTEPEPKQDATAEPVAGDNAAPTAHPSTDPGTSDDPAGTDDVGDGDTDPEPTTDPVVDSDLPGDTDPATDADSETDPNPTLAAGDHAPAPNDSFVAVVSNDGDPIMILASSTEPVVVNTIGDDPADQEPPVLTFTGLKTSYDADEILAIDCTVTDSGTGVDTSTCDSLTGRSYLFRGQNVLVGTATDLAGNSTEVTLTVTINVSAADLATALAQQISEVPEVNAALAPVVVQLVAGNCGTSFQTFVTETRAFATDETITAAESIQMYSLAIAVCRG